MKRRDTLALAASAFAVPSLALGQAAPTPRKIAVISLIGDQIHLTVYRGQLGSRIDNNVREALSVSDPVFDNTALAAATRALRRHDPAARISEVAVPKPGDATDPALIAPDGRLVADCDPVVALKSAGYTHLVLVAKHRALAQMKLAHLTIGNGFVTGLGFYIDAFTATVTQSTGESGVGFIAPYAYLMLTLIDLARPAIVARETVLASHALGSQRNKSGVDVWGALGNSEKVSLLRELIDEGIEQSMGRLLKSL